MTRWVLPLVLAAACLVAACSRQDAAWRQAEAAGTEAAYQAYLEAYPDGLNARLAQSRLARLREDREWSRAERLGTPESYQRYLARHPDGRFAAVARERLAAFLEPPPAAPVVSPPAAAATAPGVRPPSGGADHWLQLGAFVGGEAAAEEAWRRLRAEHGGPLEGLGHRIERIPLDSGDLWRLQAGPVDRGSGVERCAELVARGASCLLRAPQPGEIEVRK